MQNRSNQNIIHDLSAIKTQKEQHSKYLRNSTLIINFAEYFIQILSLQKNYWTQQVCNINKALKHEKI